MDVLRFKTSTMPDCIPVVGCVNSSMAGGSYPNVWLPNLEEVLIGEFISSLPSVGNQSWPFVPIHSGLAYDDGCYYPFRVSSADLYCEEGGHPILFTEELCELSLASTLPITVNVSRDTPFREILVKYVDLECPLNYTPGVGGIVESLPLSPASNYTDSLSSFNIGARNVGVVAAITEVFMIALGGLYLTYLAKTRLSLLARRVSKGTLVKLSEYGYIVSPEPEFSFRYIKWLLVSLPFTALSITALSSISVVTIPSPEVVEVRNFSTTDSALSRQRETALQDHWECMRTEMNLICDLAELPCFEKCTPPFDQLVNASFPFPKLEIAIFREYLAPFSRDPAHWNDVASCVGNKVPSSLYRPRRISLPPEARSADEAINAGILDEFQNGLWTKKAYPILGPVFPVDQGGRSLSCDNLSVFCWTAGNVLNAAPPELEWPAVKDLSQPSTTVWIRHRGGAGSLEVFHSTVSQPTIARRTVEFSSGEGSAEATYTRYIGLASPSLCKALGNSYSIHPGTGQDLECNVTSGHDGESGEDFALVPIEYCIVDLAVMCPSLNRSEAYPGSGKCLIDVGDRGYPVYKPNIARYVLGTRYRSSIKVLVQVGDIMQPYVRDHLRTSPLDALVVPGEREVVEFGIYYFLSLGAAALLALTVFCASKCITSKLNLPYTVGVAWLRGFLDAEGSGGCNGQKDHLVDHMAIGISGPQGAAHLGVTTAARELSDHEPVGARTKETFRTCGTIG